MKYRCLILDHDDTAVRSTPVIHYPAFLKAMAELRPGMFLTQEEFLAKNLEPGLMAYYRNDLGMNEAELNREFEIWKTFGRSLIPPFFEGLPQLIRHFRASGGILCVASLSLPEIIERDYAAAELERPDLIFGWDEDPEKVKPAPYPVREIIRQTGFPPSQLLMVDDMKPGLEMARTAGIDFAASGWGYQIPSIETYMRQNADYYLSAVSDLEKILFYRSTK